MDPQLTVALEGLPTLPNVLLQQAAFENDYKFFASDSHTGSECDTTTATCVYLWHDKFYAANFEGEDVVGSIKESGGSLYFSAAGKSEQIVRDFVDYLKSLAPVEKNDDPSKITIKIWTLGGNGPVSRSRKIEIPSWDDIYMNYTSDTLAGLEPLMNPDFRPGKAGQLILWHGEPGTGKTTALRALGKQWKDWCEMHIIADPEKFFGSSADYMLDVLISDASDDKWRLLVLEDSGELLSKDARAILANEQALSRFLNAVDGILGQGLNFMVLVTTNEPLGKLHEAVTRAGRCLSTNEFKPLSNDETTEWLNRNNLSANGKSEQTIAELYAMTKETLITPKTKAPVGFGV